MNNKIRKIHGIVHSETEENRSATQHLYRHSVLRVRRRDQRGVAHIVFVNYNECSQQLIFVNENERYVHLKERVHFTFGSLY